MRKTKENLAKPPAVLEDSQIREAEEMANEERYEAIGGETSSEGVGVGYDEEGPDASESEKAESSADGPLSRDVTDPPFNKPRKRTPKKHRGITPPHGRSNHRAAYSTKAI